MVVEDVSTLLGLKRKESVKTDINKKQGNKSGTHLRHEQLYLPVDGLLDGDAVGPTIGDPEGYSEGFVEGSSDGY